MPELKLWMAPGSCSLAPHILLRESGLDFDTMVVNAKNGFPQEYSHINPKRRLPILQLDDATITENLAIMTAISQLCSSKRLMGRTDMETVRCYEWLNWLSCTLHGEAYGGLLRPGRFSADEKAYPGINAKGRLTAEECYESIEQKLNGDYAVGDAFTAVDAYLLVFYRWGNGIGFDMKNRFPKYTSWALNLVERDSVQAAVRFEEIDPLFN